jgi:hypothetical protein
MCHIGLHNGAFNAQMDADFAPITHRHIHGPAGYHIAVNCARVPGRRRSEMLGQWLEEVLSCQCIKEQVRPPAGSARAARPTPAHAHAHAQ